MVGEGMAEQLSTMDATKRLYYFLGWDGKMANLVGLDVTTGKSVVNVEVPAFAESAFVGVGQALAWAPDSGALLAAGQDASGSWLVGELSPSTGNFMQKGFINNTDGKYDPVLAGWAAYSPDSQDLVFELGVVKPNPGIDFVAVCFAFSYVLQASSLVHAALLYIFT